jgi:hypothetical protein
MVTRFEAILLHANSGCCVSCRSSLLIKLADATEALVVTRRHSLDYDIRASEGQKELQKLVAEVTRLQLSIMALLQSQATPNSMSIT